MDEEQEELLRLIRYNTDNIANEAGITRHRLANIQAEIERQYIDERNLLREIVDNTQRTADEGGNISHYTVENKETLNSIYRKLNELPNIFLPNLQKLLNAISYVLIPMWLIALMVFAITLKYFGVI